MAASQVVHPTRATIRTVFAAVVAFAGIFPLVVSTAGLPNSAGIAVAVAVAGGITRVLALPQVEVFLQTFVPWLSATPASAAAADVAVPEYEPTEVAATASGTSTPDTP